MTTRTSNHKAHELVIAREPFKGSHTFAEWNGRGQYVVFSYGRHFPLFVYDSTTREWYQNSDKYSRTTSKHKVQLHPRGIQCTSRTTAELQRMV